MVLDDTSECTLDVRHLSYAISQIVDMIAPGSYMYRCVYVHTMVRITVFWVFGPKSSVNAEHCYSAPYVLENWGVQ